ncbi:Zn-ribbon domain-containing OB-fold protein [Luminiphilus sp.]|nr:Zn-ribbon domain-containing OB-fold protein [Luminiphilus sp.]
MKCFPTAGVRPYPPRVTSFTAKFWQSLQHGQLVTTRCGACNALTFPPKPVCPHCWADKQEWTTISPNGVLYSYTRIHAAPAQFSQALPYEVGIVDLKENLRVACRLVNTSKETLRLDADVELVAIQYEDGPLLAAIPL